MNDLSELLFRDAAMASVTRLPHPIAQMFQENASVVSRITCRSCLGYHRLAPGGLQELRCAAMDLASTAGDRRSRVAAVLRSLLPGWRDRRVRRRRCVALAAPDGPREDLADRTP